MKDNAPASARSDEHWMREALALACEAEHAGEVPIGALIVLNGEVIGRGFNHSIAESDPSAHAEIIALREAGRRRKNYRLEGCELFATIEPCAMCAGAMVHARIERLIYGADDAKAGAVRSVLQVVNHQALNHRIEVTRGVLAEECSRLLQDFFRSRRVRE